MSTHVPYLRRKQACVGVTTTTDNLEMALLLVLVQMVIMVITNRQQLHSNSQNYENSLQLSIGYYTSCSIFDTGRVACWGANSNSQMGDGTTTVRYHPHYNQVTVGDETSELLYPVNSPLRISPYVDGMNYSVSVQPNLPFGFTLEQESGAIYHDGNAALNTTHHNLTFTGEEILWWFQSQSLLKNLFHIHLGFALT